METTEETTKEIIEGKWTLGKWGIICHYNKAKNYGYVKIWHGYADSVSKMIEADEWGVIIRLYEEGKYFIDSKQLSKTITDMIIEVCNMLSTEEYEKIPKIIEETKNRINHEGLLEREVQTFDNIKEKLASLISTILRITKSSR